MPVVGAMLPDPLGAEYAQVPRVPAECGGGHGIAIIGAVSRDVGLDHDLVVPVVEPEVIRGPAYRLGTMRGGGVKRRGGGRETVHLTCAEPSGVRVGEY